MRWTVLTLCVLSAACAGDQSNSLTAPTGLTGASQTPIRGAAQLPFSGSFTLRGGAVPNCPPTCPPTTLVVTNHHVGEATQLGHFSAESVDVVTIATTSGVGTFNFTAANGDQLFTDTTGAEDEFIPPNTSKATLVAAIVGGTGRFEGATGTFTIHTTTTIDFATNTGSGSGSFDGHINLNR